MKIQSIFILNADHDYILKQVEHHDNIDYEKQMNNDVK